MGKHVHPQPRLFRVHPSHPVRTDVETWLPMFVVALGIVFCITAGL